MTDSGSSAMQLAANFQRLAPFLVLYPLARCHGDSLFSTHANAHAPERLLVQYTQAEPSRQRSQLQQSVGNSHPDGLRVHAGANPIFLVRYQQPAPNMSALDYFRLIENLKLEVPHKQTPIRS